MLVRIAAYSTSIEAHLARGRLEAEGVAAFVCHEHFVGLDWSKAWVYGGISVCVHSSDVERAREIVSAHARGEYALDDEERIVCQRCQDSDIVLRRVSWKSALLVLFFAQLPLYFRWATLRCRGCRHEWDLPATRTYPLFVVGLTAVAFGLICAWLFTSYCLGGEKFWLVFPLNSGCRW